jgi:hypothetical protein
MGEGCLAKAGRSIEQDVVQRFTSALRRCDGNAKILFNLFLPDELIEAARPQAGVKRSIFNAGFT